MAQVTEVAVLSAVDEALSSLEDGAARARVIRWAAEKFSVVLAPVGQLPAQSARQVEKPRQSSTVAGDEIPGVARLLGDEIKLVARDIKASSTNDAAVRLAHVTIRAYELLTGDSRPSSSKVLVPVLKAWRAYTGNTRQVLANQKGLLRVGDEISLDEHARREADIYIQQINDPAVEGTWRPSGAPKRAAKKSPSRGSKR